MSADRISLLKRAADATGVALPKPISDLLDFDLGFPEQAAVERAAVAEIAEAIGARNYSQRRDEALRKVAEAGVANRVSTGVRHALTRRQWATIESEAPALVEAFRNATEADVKILNEYARLVPATATPKTDALLPAQYEARFLANGAAERLEQVVAALAPLYRSEVSVKPLQKARTMLVDLPSPLNAQKAVAISDGLIGVRPMVTAGSINREGGFLWWAVVAAQGASFRLASPDEYRSNLERLNRANEDRSGSAAVAAIVR